MYRSVFFLANRCVTNVSTKIYFIFIALGIIQLLREHKLLYVKEEKHLSKEEGRGQNRFAIVLEQDVCLLP